METRGLSPGFLLMTLGAACLALAKSPKISVDLDTVENGSMIDVIVQYRQTPADEQHRKMRARGGSHKSDLHLRKGGLYRVPASALREIANDPDVEFVSKDRAVRSTALDYARETVNAISAQRSGYKGNGVGVAIIDSGIFNFGDL